MQFRYDINGLRAIAVIAVVLFHFNAVWVPGGFAGVDVFFVISGFLMTGIIFRGLENDNFNLFKFYVARANRIIPALAVLCLVLLFFGWFYLTPLDYRALGKHVASSMSFFSNVIYWRESGYFDVASHEKWLLHTWSLSVEWQFYIIYPIILVALKKFLSLENLKRLIVIGTFLGFCLSIVATMKWPNLAYYLLPTRAWEMMTGGIAFLYPWNISESKKKIAELIGVALILSSYAFMSGDIPWPGYFALLPVLGAYLMIISNQKSSIITNNSLFQYLGKRSYSIYLWHWPIVVYGYYFDIQNWVLYGLPLSVILGCISFNFVEGVKFKSFERWSDFLKVKPVYMVLFVVFVGALIFSFHGFKFHYSKPVLLASMERNNYSPFRDDCFFDDICYFRNGSKIDPSEDVDYILFGDSHSLSQLTVVLNAIKPNEKLLYIGSSACLFVPDIYTAYYDTPSCDDKIDLLYKTLNTNKSARLIMVERSNIYFTGYNVNEKEFVYKDIRISRVNGAIAKDAYINALCNLSVNREVFVTKPTPEFLFDVPNEVAKQMLFKHQNDIDMSIMDYQKRNNNTQDIFNQLLNCGVNVIDPVPYLCDKNKCFTVKNGRPIYRDDDHLSEYGNKLLLPMYKEAFEKN